MKCTNCTKMRQPDNYILVARINKGLVIHSFFCNEHCLMENFMFLHKKKIRKG